MENSSNAHLTENYRITSLLVNPSGRIGLYGTLNLIQETAWVHAERLGFGISSMETAGLYWVLTRQVLKMKKWPRYGENFRVQTWLRPPEGAFLTREFSLLNDKNEEIGFCVTTWLALTRDTKKILPLQDLYDWKSLTWDRSCGLIPEKIPVEGTYEKMAKYRVRNSDLDINQHVNNTKYAQWILDAIPYELHQKLALTTYSVNFLAETHLGDEVQVERRCDSADTDLAQQGTTHYRGLRLGDGKILFTALLEWEKRS